MPLVTTCITKLHTIQRILHDRMNILKMSVRLQNIFTVQNHLSSYIVETRIYKIYWYISNMPNTSMEKSLAHTNVKRDVSICYYIRDHHILIGDKPCIFKDNISCKMSNVVYSIFCYKCSRVVFAPETGTTTCM